MVESTGAAKGGSRSCLIGIIVAVSAVGILAMLAVPAVQHALELANRAACKGNLKQIGTACHTWAKQHEDRWPDAFTEESTRWDEVGGTRTDRWDPVEEDGEPPPIMPGDNHGPVNSNTACFWTLIAATGLPQDCFLCPSTGGLRDWMVTDFSKVRDFRGENFCGYSLQNMLCSYMLSEGSERVRHPNASHMAVVADANPMRRDFWSNAPGGGPAIGITNRRLAERPKFEEGEETQPWNDQVKHIRRAWELNSPNHQFKGTNILYLDGHVEWQEHPYCGPNWDNIWLRRRTDVTTAVDQKSIATIRAYNDESSYDGRSTLPEGSTDDSFLVP